jgi:hypothetical protein
MCAGKRKVCGGGALLPLSEASSEPALQAIFRQREVTLQIQQMAQLDQAGTGAEYLRLWCRISGPATRRAWRW